MAIVWVVNFRRNHHAIKFCLNSVVLPWTLQPWGGFTDAILEGSHIRMAVQSFKTYCVLAFNYVLHIRPYNLIYTCINVLSLNSTLGFNAILFSDAILFTNSGPQPGVAMVQLAPKTQNWARAPDAILFINSDPPSYFRTPSCLWIQVRCQTSLSAFCSRQI